MSSILPENERKKMKTLYYINQGVIKSQIISKANYGILNSSKKQTNKFVFTTIVFVRFLEEIEDTKKTFRNYLTFS